MAGPRDDLFATTLEPMLAKVAESLPAEGDFLYEPKWDGFRALVFHSGAHGLSLQSRDGHPFDRYFPELHEALAARLPRGTIVDGEIVVQGQDGLDFDALQQRLHPAESRVRKLSRLTPASFVAFDLLAAGGKPVLELPQHERRTRLERLLASAVPPLYLTPATRDVETARRWLAEFEGAGLDGVIAKPLDAPYQPGKRAMWKVKHARTADCVVAGLRWHKSGPGVVGSLLLGLFDDAGVLHHAGVTSSFTMQARRELAGELAPLFVAPGAAHPWIATATAGAAPAEPSRGDAAPRRAANGGAAEAQRRPGAESRWSAGKDLSWQALRPERVCEVKYDHLQGDRFRHATTFLRWRSDKPPSACRYDQLEVAAPYELRHVFGRAPSA